MDEAIQLLVVLLPLMFVGGGVLVMLMGMYQHMKTVEMKHRERLAMIERGLAPPPELEPAAFEHWQRRERKPPARSTSIGVVIVALGLGLGMIIGFAAESPEIALGVGGAIVILGAAFIVNGELHRRSHPSFQPPPYPAHAGPPPNPPGTPPPPQ